MCLAVPAKVVEINDQLASVEVQGVRRAASMMLLPEARVGDYVLVHAGFAMQIVEAEEAERILSGSVGGAPKRRTKVSVGDTVRISSGAFEDYAGKITSIDSSGLRVQVDVEGTPLDVEIDQVELI